MKLVVASLVGLLHLLRAPMLLLLLHHLLLHLLHLLHHLRVHAAAHHVLGVVATSSAAHHLLHLLHLHHLLPHGWVHVHVPVHGHLRLHHSEVLLHALEILRHDLGRHAAVIAHLLAHGALAGLVLLFELVPLGSLLLLAEIASGLCSLHLDGLAVDLERDINASLDAGLAFKSHEPEPSWPARVLVHHERCVDNSPELSKVVPEFLVRRFLTNAADKNFARLFLFISGNGSLGVNLVG